MAKEIELLTKAQREKAKAALRRAVRLCKTQTVLADRLDISYQYMSKLMTTGFVPTEQLMKIEAVTLGKVRRHELRPDLYARMKFKYTDKYELTDDDE